MRPALLIAAVNLRRTLRDRTGLFFVFLFPLILIIALGSVFGGSGGYRLGIAAAGSGTLGDELAALISDGASAVETSRYQSYEALRGAVEDGVVEMGVLVPESYDEQLRNGETATLTVVARPADSASVLRQEVDRAIAAQAARVNAARLASDVVGVEFDQALERASALQEAQPGIDISVTTAGTAIVPADAGPLAFGAQSQTILFMFLTSMTAATQLILTRQLGVSRRMLATSTPVRSILGGELLGRFGVAMLQGVFIVVASALLFGVAWGDLLAASLIIVAFALIGTGVAMIVGVFANNVDQAGAIGVVAGLVLGAIGGAMVPAELFEEPLSTISRLTPHSWAIDALRDVAFRGAAVADILLQLAVLGAMALVLVAIGTWGLRRSLIRGA